MIEAGIGRNAGLAVSSSSPMPKQMNSSMNKNDKANRLLSLSGSPVKETLPRKNSQSE
jgi:hypothetical protein